MNVTDERQKDCTRNLWHTVGAICHSSGINEILFHQLIGVFKQSNFITWRFHISLIEWPNHELWCRVLLLIVQNLYIILDYVRGAKIRHDFAVTSELFHSISHPRSDNVLDNRQ